MVVASVGHPVAAPQRCSVTVRFNSFLFFFFFFFVVFLLKMLFFCYICCFFVVVMVVVASVGHPVAASQRCSVAVPCISF